MGGEYVADKLAETGFPPPVSRLMHTPAAAVNRRITTKNAIPRGNTESGCRGRLARRRCARSGRCRI